MGILMDYADQAELDCFLGRNPSIEVLELIMPDFSGIARCKRIQRSEFKRLFSGSFLSPQSAPAIRYPWRFLRDNTLSGAGWRSRSDYSPHRRHPRGCPVVRIACRAGHGGLYH